jgi:hypothetical protein
VHRNRLLMLILGLMISGGSGWAMYRFSGEMEEKRQVLIVTKRIQALERFSAANVKAIKIPDRYVLPGAVSSPQELTGKMAALPMYEGEQIISSKIDPGRIIPRKEERYLVVPIKGVPMKPGQKVDIYYAYEPGRSPYTGVEKVLSDKIVAFVLDETGRNIQGKEGDLNTTQAGIEILVTQEELQVYLEKGRHARNTIIVKHGEVN